MEGCEAIYGDGAALGQTHKLNYSSLNLPVDYIVASAASKSSPGSTSMLSFGAVCGKKRSGDSFFQSFEQEEIGDEYLDEYFNQLEKKKRLSVEQIQFLERSFELDNKLEPERKVQLAKELNLQPRQIAVWFQNRRARWKTRQLETDYETLQASYTSLKIDYDSLLKENEKLKAEVLHIKCNGAAMDTEKSISGSHDTEKLSESISKEAVARTISEDEETKVSTLVFKNEEQSSAKSDVTNVESPWLTDGSQSSMLGSGDSSRFFEANRSDLSQNGGNNLVEDLLLPDYTFLKIDDARCHMHVSSFYYGFPVEDHTFGFLSS